jgi:hypothetical protein
MMVRYLSSPISMVSIKDCTISQKIKRASEHARSACEEASNYYCYTSLVTDYVIFLFFNVGNHSFQTKLKLK